MNKSLFHIAFAILCCLCVRVSGQVDLSGIILDETDSLGIEGVEVFDHNSNTIAATDEQGRFIFQGLDAGLHFLTILADGYETLEDSIQLTSNQNITFSLSKLNYSLSTVEVLARREELFAIKQLKDTDGTSIFAGKKTEVVIMDLVKGNVANNNSRQVYAQVSGLNIFEGSDGGLQLNIGGRGLDPNRTSNFNTRQNGYDISADVLGYPESYYTPPVEALSEIRIIRGASSLQYGTQFGGLIDFKFRRIPTFKKLEIRSNQTVSSFNTFNSFNSIALNKGKFSVHSFYNYKNGDGYRSNSQFTSHNGFVSVDFKPSERSKITGEITYFTYLAKQAGGLTDEQFEATPSLSTRERNWFHVNWKLFNLHYSQKIGNSTTFSASLFHLNAARNSVGYRGNPIDLNENPITSLDEQDVNGNYITPRDLIRGSFKNFGLEVKSLSTYQINSKKAVFLIGGKYYNANNTSEQGPGTSGVDANFSFATSDYPDYANQSDFKFPNLNLAIFSENIFYLSNRLSITPGIRFEHINTKSNGTYNQVIFDNAQNPIGNNLLSENKELARQFVLLGLGVNYKKSKKLNFIANVSQNYRSVTFSDIRVVSPTFIIDPDIRDEKGLSADFGINGRIDKVMSYELTAYSVLYNDRIGIILDDRANRVRKNAGRALIAGIESLVNVNIGRWISPNNRQWGCNLFLNSAYTYSEYIESEENNVVGKRVEFVPAISLKSGLTMGYKNAELTYQYSYVSEQFTDVQNSTRALAGDNRSGIIGSINAYHISDLTLSYDLKLFKVHAGVNNLFDRAYFTRRATGYPGPGIIPSDGRSYFVTLAYMLSK